MRSNDGGSVTVTDAGVAVRGADRLTVLVAAASTFEGWSVPPGRDPRVALRAATALLDAVAVDKLRERHVEDHLRLYERAELQLGRSVDLPTDERIKAVAAGGNDPDLVALMVNFGRYLLMASSRPGTQAANLQGIWNQDRRPMWASDWTNNINTQMNYWPADLTGLGECFDPLTDLLEGLAESGAQTARTLYDAPGWVSHHNADIWRATWPVGEGGDDPVWSMCATCGVWLTAHLMEHYRFQLDVDFLRDRAYPLIAGAAEFVLSMLVEDRDGVLQFIPSTAPEHHFVLPSGEKASVDLTSTYDIWLIRELFANLAEAEGVLGLTSDLAARASGRAGAAAADPYGVRWPATRMADRLAAVRDRSPPPVAPLRALPGCRDRPDPYAGMGCGCSCFVGAADQGRDERRVDRRVVGRALGTVVRAGEGVGRDPRLSEPVGVGQPAAP